MMDLPRRLPALFRFGSTGATTANSTRKTTADIPCGTTRLLRAFDYWRENQAIWMCSHICVGFLKSTIYVTSQNGAKHKPPKR